MYNTYDGYSFLAVFIAFLIALPFIAIVYVLTSLFFMKIFEKAGVEGKWRAWVPVYNTLVFVKLGDLNPWWLLVLWGGYIVLSWVPVLGWLIGVAAFVYTILAAYRVGQKLQKDGAWIVLYIFVSIVWLGIAAFDRSRWNTAVAPAPWADNFLADKTVWQGVPAQTPAAGGYTAPPAGYAQPGGYPPPAAPQPPVGTQPPAAPTQPPVPPQSPASPEPPAAPQPPAADEPPTDPDAPRQ